MMYVCTSGRLSHFILSLIALSIPVAASSASQPRVIDASGQPMNSVFDGLTSNQHIRDTLVLKIVPPRRAASPNVVSSDIRSMFAQGPTANANGCPTGTICAQPLTAPVPGIFCEDNDGCGVDVHNQGPGTNPNKGTFEGYQCSICCVDWFECDISSSPPPVPPDDPCLNATVPLTPGPTGTDYNSPDCSPIIVDTEGEGFRLTSAQTGVAFDISGTGHPVQLAWTDGHFHNAFLALPGPDGLVHNGKELFGNFTPQPQSAHPNGFNALAQFDKPENGGNGDGIIDVLDAVFSKLRLWIDENHDGICQPEELHRLPELGVYSLSFSYVESRRTDQFGNQFRYKARVNPGERRDPRDQTPSGDPGRWAYDVFLATQ
jgi:hypothetical protein